MAKKKKIYISMRLHKEPTTKPPMRFIMPQGCVGLMFAFRSLTAAKKFDSNDIKIDYVEAETEDKTNG